MPDDAVLSLGQFMQTTPCHVVTVFAGVPAPDVLTDYDKARGVSGSAAAMNDRRTEDRDALDALGATWTHLDLLDRQYRDKAVLDLSDLFAELRTLLATDRQVYVPLGIGHPDHRAVADAVITACPPNRSVLFYEELPYRVLYPEAAASALAILDHFGWAHHTLPEPLDVGDRDVKAKAIGCYRSQFPNGADDPCLLVPERCWRYWRCA